MSVVLHLDIAHCPVLLYAALCLWSGSSWHNFSSLQGILQVFHRKGVPLFLWTPFESHV